MYFKGFWKRGLAVLLAAVTVATSVDVTAFAASGVGTAQEGEWEVSAAELVANKYYGYGTDEPSDIADIVTSGAINSGTVYTSKVPVDDDRLVSLKQTGLECEVTAEDYTSNGQTWKPVKVQLKAAEDDAVMAESDSWTVEGGKSVVTLTIPENADSYYAAVEYSWSVTVDEAEETRLLNLTKQLVAAKESMEEVVALDIDLSSLVSAFSDMNTKVQENITELKKVVENAYVPAQEKQKAQDSIDKLNKLSEKITAAENAAAALRTWIADYDATDFQAKFHWDNGAAIKEDAANAWTQINSLYQNVNENKDALSQSVGSAAIDSLISVLENFVLEDPQGMMVNGSLTEIKNASWDFLQFAPGFTGQPDGYLDSIVETLVGTDVEVYSKIGTYLVAKQTVNCELNVTKIYVTLKASVASDEAVDFDERNAVALKELVPLKNDENPIRQPFGTSKAAVLEKISAAKNNMVSAWAGYEIPSAYFTETDDDAAKIPETLGEADEKIEWTVTYSPVNFNVTFVGETTETKAYPYGTKIYLTKNADEAKCWDYTIESAPAGRSVPVSDVKPQGEVIVVTEDIKISRKEYPASAENRVLDKLAADTQYQLNANEIAIFTSSALKSDPVEYRVPSGSLVTFEFDEDNQMYVVTAAESSAGIGKTWVPDKVQVMNGDTDVVGSYSLESGSASWAADAHEVFTKINVIYKHKVESDDAKILSYLNLPVALKDNISVQKSLLVSDNSSDWTAQKIYGQFTSDIMSVLKKDTLSSASLLLSSTEAKAAVTNLLNQGWNDTADEPAVYSILKNADAVGWSFAVCVERGYYSDLVDQIDLFAKNLDAIVNDSNLNNVLESQGYGDKKDALTDLNTSLKELDDKLKANPMHPSFNQKDGALVTLINTIDAADDLKAYTAADLEGKDGIYAYTGISQAKPGTYMLTITLDVEGKGTKEATITVEKDAVITQSDINEKIAELESAHLPEAKELAYYKAPVISISEGFAADQPVKADASYSKSYALKTYTVQIVHENGKVDTSKTFKYGDQLGIELTVKEPAEGFYYKFFAEGVEVTGSKWFEPEELNTKFVDGVYTITCKAINIKEENFEKFISSLNENLSSLKDSNGQPMATFVPVKNAEDKYESVVLRLSATMDLQMSEVLSALVTTFTSLSYDNIGFGTGLNKTDFKKTVEKVGENDQTYEEYTLNPQALADLLLNGGISSTTLLNVINEDGTVKPMELEGTDAYLGGQLMKNKLHLGNLGETADVYDFYITLMPTDTAMLSSLRSLLATSETYASFALTDGAVEVNATLPENVYKIYMSAMLLLDRVDLDTMEDRELADEIEEIKDILYTLLVESNTTVDAQTLQNTLAANGLNVDLTSFSRVVDMMIKAVKNTLEQKNTGGLIFTDSKGSGASYQFKMEYDLKNQLGQFEDMGIDVDQVFASTKLSIQVYMNVWNYSTDFAYEAIIVDVKGEGVAGKLQYAESLNEALANASGPVYAILLKDIAGDINVKNATVLDLNGKTITGTVAAGSANLRIVSRILDSVNAGGITGDVTGTAVRVASGIYLDAEGNVLALGNKLQNGYVQDAQTGAVTNVYYNIQDTETEMKVTVDLEQIMAQIDKGNIQTLVLDMVSDVFLNQDIYAGVKVDEKTLYNVNIEDVLGLIGDVREGGFQAVKDELMKTADMKEIRELANKIADDLINRDKLINAITEGGEFASYTFELAPWVIVPTVKDDVIKVGIGAGAAKTKTVSLYIEPLNEEQEETLRELFQTGKDIISVTNRVFDRGTISFVDGSPKWDGSAAATVTVDLSGKDGEASDYVTVLAMILANNSDDKEAFAKDIVFYKDNVWGENLEDRVNALSIGDLINALEAAKGKNLDSIIAALGLTEQVENLEELKSTYDILLKLGTELSAVVNNIVDRENRVSEGVRNYYAKPLTGLYDGETAKASNVELKVVLKIFAEEYNSTVQDVIDMINALPEEFAEEKYADFKESGVVLENLDLLKIAADAAEEAYEALSGDAKAIAEDRCDIEKIANIAEYLEIHMATYVIALIEKLPAEFGKDAYAAFLESGRSLEDCGYAEADVRAAAAAARTAYDLLDADDKTYVNENTDYARLTNAEDFFNKKDSGAAADVIGALSAWDLNEEDVPADYDAFKAAVAAARAAYEALNDAAKALVDPEVLQKLTTAEEFIRVNDAKMQNVVDLFDALPAEFANAEYEGFFADMDEVIAALEAARAAYNALGENAQAYVKNLLGDEFIMLENGEKYLAENEVLQFIQTVNSLPAAFEQEGYTGFIVNFDEMAQIVADADALWTGLSADQIIKGYVEGKSNTAKLTNAILYFRNAPVVKVLEMIEELPDVFAEENYQAFLELEDSQGEGSLLDNLEEILYASADTNDAYADLADTENGEAAKEYVAGKPVYSKLKNALNYFAHRVGLWIAEVEGAHYTGKAIKPEVRVYEGAVRLTNKVDYTVSYKNNTAAFELAGKDAKTLKSKAPQAVVTFKKNYSGTIYKYFDIYQIDLSRYNDPEYRAEVGLEIQNEVYAAAAKKAAAVRPAVYLNGKKMSGSLYKVSLWENYGTENAKMLTSKDKMPAGDYTVKLEGLKHFKGEWTVAQYVDEVLMSKVSIGKIATQTYANGAEIKPELVVKYKNKVLPDGYYTVSYKNNIEIGTATVTITGTKDDPAGLGYSFTGTKSATFKIGGIKMSSKMVNMPKVTKYYTGSEIVLLGDTYAGDNEIPEYSLVYSTKNLTALMREDVDYTVSYLKNIKKGTATVVFTGKGNYTGTVKKTFAIKAADIRTCLDENSVYTGITAAYEKNGVKPADQVKLYFNGTELVNGKDYTISWKNYNAVAGPEAGKKAPTLTITGKGNYTGKLTAAYTISAAVFKDNVTGTAKDVLWSNKKNNFKTSVTLVDDNNGKKLASGTDYESSKYYTYERFDGTNWVTVQNNEKLVFAENQTFIKMRVTVNGAGKKYTTGDVDAEVIEYRIYKTAVSKAKIDRNTKAIFTYNRYEQVYTSADLKLYADSKKTQQLEQYYENLDNRDTADYEVVYAKNIFAGTAIAEIKGLNGYGGTKKIVFTIKKNKNVSHLDDRLHFFDDRNILGDAILYEATVLFEY